MDFDAERLKFIKEILAIIDEKEKNSKENSAEMTYETPTKNCTNNGAD